MAEPLFPVLRKRTKIENKEDKSETFEVKNDPKLKEYQSKAMEREKQFKMIMSFSIVVWVALIAIVVNHIDFENLDANASWYDYLTASLKQSRDAISCVVRQGANVFVDDWNALHCAVQVNNLFLLKLARTFFINLNTRGFNGTTPLHIACHNRDKRLVKWLLANGADLSLADGQGRQSIHWAASADDASILRHLISHNRCDINALTNQNTTPLHIASEFGRESIVKLLLEEGVDAKKSDVNGWTALHFATQVNNTHIIRLLIEKGNADVNAQTKDGLTSLHIAAFHGCKRALDWLLEHDQIDSTVVDNQGHTALYYSAIRKNSAGLEKMLEEGINIEDLLKDKDASFADFKAANTNPSDYNP